MVKLEDRRQNAERHERRESRHEAQEDAQKELMEQTLFKMQNTKLVNTINGILTKRLRNVIGQAEIEAQEETELSKREAAERGQIEGETETPEQRLLREQIALLHSENIDSSTFNPVQVEFYGRPLTADEVASASIMQFANGQYDEHTVDLTSVPYVIGQGRVGIAIEIIRQIMFDYIVNSMRKKYAPEDLYEMWMMLVDTGVVLPEVNNVAEEAIKYMMDKLTPEEMSLTTPARLAATIVDALKEVYTKSALQGDKSIAALTGQTAGIGEVGEPAIPA